jgi:hypothetical protein
MFMLVIIHRAYVLKLFLGIPHFHNIHHQTLRLSTYIQGKLNLFVIVVNLMCSRIWLEYQQLQQYRMETYVFKQDNSNYLNDICYKKYINK